MDTAHSTSIIRRNLAKFATLLFLAALPSNVAAQSEQDRLADGEILISTEDVEGKDFPRVNVKAVIDAPPKRVIDLVSSCEGKSEILPSVSESHVVTKEGEGELCSETFDLPFPLGDLVSVARTTTEQQGDTYKNSWELVRGDFEYSHGFFLAKPFQGDKARTLLIYQNHFKPNLSIPDWLTGAFLEQGMPDMVKAIRKAAR